MAFPSRRLALVALALTVAGGARSAAAQERVVVWSVSATGTGAAPLREQFSRSIAGGMAAAGLAVVPRAEIERRLASTPGLVGCETSPCLGRVAELLQVSRIVRGRVEVFGSSYVFRLEQLAADAGALGSIDGRCDVCTIAEINEQLSRAAVRLARSVAPRPAPPAPAPKAPRPAPPAPAPVAPAVRVTVTPPPAAAPPPAPAAEAPALPAPGPEPVSRLRLWKWTAAGAAAALVVIGAVLVGVDGGGTCTAQGGRACPRLYDTSGAGWAMTGLGLAAAGGAGFLFWVDAAHPAAGGARTAGLGLRGRF
jgi:hypothetical protein